MNTFIEVLPSLLELGSVIACWVLLSWMTVWMFQDIKTCWLRWLSTVVMLLILSECFMMVYSIVTHCLRGES